MKRHIFSTILILLLISVFLANVLDWFGGEDNLGEGVNISFETNGSKILEAGDEAPNFTLQTLNGETFELFENRDKPLLLNFWASWCPPCKAEMPHMQSVYEKYSDQVEIVAVNLTNQDNGVEAVKSFQEEYGLTFPIPLDQKGEVGRLYSILTIPTSYFINTDGTIYQKYIGPMNEETILSIVEEME